MLLYKDQKHRNKFVAKMSSNNDIDTINEIKNIFVLFIRKLVDFIKSNIILR